MKKFMTQEDYLIIAFAAFLMLFAILGGLKIFLTWGVLIGLSLWIRFSKTEFAKRVRNTIK